MGITTAANALVAARGHVGKREPLRAGDAVVLYTHALAPGGAERQWCYLAIELQKMGFLVTVVCANPLEGSSAHYLPLLEAAGVPVLSLSSMPNGAESEAVLGGDHFGVLGVTDWNSTYLGHAARLTLCLERLSPRAVIAQLDTPNIVAALSGLIAGTPQVVLSMRNHNPSWFPYIDLPWLKPLYQTVTRSRRIVLSGNSRSGNMDYASWMGVPDSEFHWIPNAIDQDDHPRPTDDALAALRSQLGIVPGARVVLGVFRLSPEKRPLDFIEVCSGLASRLGQLRVFIAGEGPLSTTMLEAIGSRGLGETITLLGRRTDIDALMAVSDVLLLTSDREGMPNAVMEAQIAGLPVVATSSGGIIDCVEHDETGLLADVGDIEGMVAHCEALLCDRKLASRIRAKALSEVKRRFSKARMAAAYIDLLNLNSHGTEQ
jgi:glycosyltransferase involved in cell wall biosynthesis